MSDPLSTLRAAVYGAGVVLAMAFATAAWSAVAADARDVGPDTIDVSSFPPEVREVYPLFQVKCSKCHSLARPINSSISGDEWKGYIKKMIRRPASGINEEVGQRIFGFLKFYTVNKASAQADGGSR